MRLRDQRLTRQCAPVCSTHATQLPNTRRRPIHLMVPSAHTHFHAFSLRHIKTKHIVRPLLALYHYGSSDLANANLFFMHYVVIMLKSTNRSQNILGPKWVLCELKSSAIWEMVSSTHGAIDVGLSPHRVMLLVDHLGTTQHVEILHHILLNICQCGNLSEVACWAERRRGKRWCIISLRQQCEWTGSLWSFAMQGYALKQRWEIQSLCLQNCFTLQQVSHPISAGLYNLFQPIAPILFTLVPKQRNYIWNTIR